MVVEPLAEALSAQRRWLVRSQHPGLEAGLVFPASPRQGTAGAARLFRLACERAGVTEISAHRFRRTENVLRKGEGG